MFIIAPSVDAVVVRDTPPRHPSRACMPNALNRSRHITAATPVALAACARRFTAVRVAGKPSPIPH